MLTRTYRDLLALLASGSSADQIAARLGLSEPEVHELVCVLMETLAAGCTDPPRSDGRKLSC